MGQENGQCLFATKPYTLSNKTLGADFDPPVHVTNLCLNATEKNKDNFLRKKPVIGKGQQIRMRQLVSYLTDTYPPSINTGSTIRSFTSLRTSLVTLRRHQMSGAMGNCFVTATSKSLAWI